MRKISSIILKGIFYATAFFVIIIFLSTIRDNLANSKINKYSTKLNSCYLSYKNSIYHFETKEFTYYKKMNIDESEFTILDQHTCIGKDSRSVYFEDKKIENADINSFKLLTYDSQYRVTSLDYSVDKNFAYYLGDIIEGADPSSFKVIDQHNAQDNKNNYFDGLIVQ